MRNNDNVAAKKGRHIRDIIAMIIIFMLVFAGLSKLFVHTFSHNEIRVKNFFYQDKNSIDVVFIGASEIFTGISNMDAWKKYGVTSYNLSASALTMNMSKSMLKEVMKRQDPKVIVISLNGCVYDDRQSREGMERFWMDNMPLLSYNRIKTVQEVNYTDEKSAFYIPLIKYHANDKSLKENWKYTKQEIKNAVLKESLISQTVYLSAETHEKRDEKILDVKNFRETKALYDDAERDLNELLDFCEENNIKDRVVFINMPAYYTESLIDNKKRVNMGREIVKHRGYKVYDLDDYKNEIGISLYKDYYNTGHPNVLGQEKITKFVFDKLVKDYNIQGNYSKKIKDRWDRDYKDYEKMKKYAKNDMSEKPKNKNVYEFEDWMRMKYNLTDE